VLIKKEDFDHMNKKLIIVIMILFAAAVCLAFPADSLAAEAKITSTTQAQSTAKNLEAVSNITWEVGKTSRQIILRWDAVEGAEGYTVYKAAASSEEYTKVKSVTGTRCTVTGLKKGKAYKFAVKAQVSYEGAVFMSQSQAEKTVTTPKILKRSTKGFENTNACKVLRTAKKKLGCAYVYGAAGPNAFDCSGYVYYVYKHVSGIKHVARTSAQGLYSGYRSYYVGNTLSCAQPGDIMLFNHGSGSSITHAAIYWGNGKIIHASDPSTGVILGEIGSYRHLVAVMRVSGL
jgi:cell wall-associated NlpC family hydrolase